MNVLVRRRQRVLETPAQALQQLLLVRMAPRGLLFFGHAGEGRGFLGDGRGFLGGARRSAGFELLGVRIGVGEVESIPATRSVGVARARWPCKCHTTGRAVFHRSRQSRRSTCVPALRADLSRMRLDRGGKTCRP